MRTDQQCQQSTMPIQLQSHVNASGHSVLTQGTRTLCWTHLLVSTEDNFTPIPTTITFPNPGQYLPIHQKYITANPVTIWQSHAISSLPIQYQSANLLLIQCQSITNTSDLCVNRKGTSILYGSLTSLIGGWFCNQISDQSNANPMPMQVDNCTLIFLEQVYRGKLLVSTEDDFTPIPITDLLQSRTISATYPRPSCQSTNPMPIHNHYIWHLRQ